MPAWASFAAVPAMLVALTAPQAVASQEIAGRLLDSTTGDPIPEMEVVVRPAGAGRGRAFSTKSASDGRFSIVVDTAGSYVMALARLGYSRVATTDVLVEPGRNVFLELHVAPSALGIEPIRVVVSRRNPYLEAEGFYRRLEDGWGQYMTRKDIERFPSTWPTHILRRFRGVEVSGGRPLITRCVRGAQRVLLDGMEIPGIELDNVLSRDQIVAIEVYATPEAVPVELRRHLTCGVIAIWTTWGASVMAGS